jgi:hypothetical protein
VQKGNTTAKAAALRVNLNVQGCGIVAPPMHATWRFKIEHGVSKLEHVTDVNMHVTDVNMNVKDGTCMLQMSTCMLQM